MSSYQKPEFGSWPVIQNDPSLKAAIEGMVSAGEILQPGFNRNFDGARFVRQPNPVAYIGQSERLIAEAIRRANPLDLIIGKTINQQTDHTQGQVWLLNGIDGFANFANGLEPCDVMIAQVENGELIRSAVYDFLHGELFYAARGKGSYKNGEQLVIPDSKMEKSTLITYAPLFDRDEAENTEDKILVSAIWRGKERISEKYKQIQREYQAGGLELCWVAEGRLQGYASSWTTRHNLLSVLNVREAGGIATDIYGNALVKPGTRGAIAGPPRIQPVMLKEFQRYLPG